MSAGTGRSPWRPELCEQYMSVSKSNWLSPINKWDQGHEFQCSSPLYNGPTLEFEIGAVIGAGRAVWSR